MEFLHFLDKSTFFCENGAKLPHRSHLGLPSSFPGSALGERPLKRHCFRLHHRLLTIRVYVNYIFVPYPLPAAHLGSVQ